MPSNVSKMAKMAAEAIRTLNSTNRELAAKNAEYSVKLATLEKERECLKLAREMAERGQIDRSFDSVEKTAQGLLGKNLEVVKEAMALTTSGLRLAEPITTGSSGEDLDPLTRALLEP